LQMLLRDAAETRFIIVTRAAALPRLETERLARSLRALRLSMRAIVVNAMTLAPGSCRWCRRVARAERRVMGALSKVASTRRRVSGRCAIIETPLCAPPPTGASALEEWAAGWIGEQA